MFFVYIKGLARLSDGNYVASLSSLCILSGLNHDLPIILRGVMIEMGSIIMKNYGVKTNIIFGKFTNLMEVKLLGVNHWSFWAQ